MQRRGGRAETIAGRRAALGFAAAFSLALAVASPATAATFVETFDAGSNTGGWTIGGEESLEPAGGNPTWHLHAVVDTFAPQPRTSLGSVSPYTGDLRAAGVIGLGIDLITHAVDFSAEDRPLSLILYSENSTPGDFDDDWGAYTMHASNIPLPGEGWKGYDFAVPSQSVTLPPGWAFIQFGANAPPPDWNLLITKVSQVRFFYGNPEFFFIFQFWDIGMDNPRVAFADAGAPGRIPPTLRLSRSGATALKLEWAAPLCGAAANHGIYAGTLGSWYSHGIADCSDDGGDLQETLPLPAGSRYYLVVPSTPGAEGSYGKASSGAERPAAAPACRAAQSIACP